MATILGIDDAAPIRLLLSTALQSEDHDVMQASSGREGLSLYQQRPLDLVIVDMMMPELNGLQTIMAFTRAFLNVKVIAVSGMIHDIGRIEAHRRNPKWLQFLLDSFAVWL